jgi:tRNA pseudouridine13 synthase
LRAVPEDFQVDEVLGFEPNGEGQHVLLQVCKTDINTEQVARHLAKSAGVHPRDVGYSGLKDRNAVTSQWFSLFLTNRRAPQWSALESNQIKVLQGHRHTRKLKRGTARGNRFRIRIRGIAGTRDAAEARLHAIHEKGSPNYFGEQRFGRDYGNLERAAQLFQGTLKRLKPHLRGLYLSAARAQIFNELLGERVGNESWNRALPGDLMQLEGSRSWFAVSKTDDEIERRIQAWDIHPTGPMWGKGELPSFGRTAETEQRIANRFSTWCQGLERFGLKQERRSLRMRVGELGWEWGEDYLDLKFRLPAGCFATAVLREIVRSSA